MKSRVSQSGYCPQSKRLIIQCVACEGMNIESSVQSSLLNMLESTENRRASNEPQTNDASSDALHP